MTAQKFNARDVQFQVEDFLSPGTWVSVAPGSAGSEGGITTFSRSREYETTDTTTFGSAGQAESQIMQLGKTIKLEGFLLKDPLTGALDPGQALIEAQTERLGTDSQCGFRFWMPGDANWEVWAKATFQIGDTGGGNNDKVGWSVTVTRSGLSTTAVKV
ncbi:phage tail tube protein [Streptomyces vinaceus]|uniref:phage tail tube protein n=1 Tax=Streptomyces vinaceus TaxID=1960 RepID=UPI0036B49FB6